jgi:hypothetical protein
LSEHGQIGGHGGRIIAARDRRRHLVFGTLGPGYYRYIGRRVTIALPFRGPAALPNQL